LLSHFLLVPTPGQDLFCLPAFQFLKNHSRGFALVFQTCKHNALIRVTPSFTYSGRAGWYLHFLGWGNFHERPYTWCWFDPLVWNKLASFCFLSSLKCRFKYRGTFYEIINMFI
jgi:hypothetical protein